MNAAKNVNDSTSDSSGDDLARGQDSETSSESAGMGEQDGAESLEDGPIKRWARWIRNPFVWGWDGV